MRKSIVSGLLIAAVTLNHVPKANGGTFATEFTQVLNHGQLVMEYLRQGQELATAIDQLKDAVKNSQFSTELTFGAIARDIESLDRIVMGGQALAYSLGNLDALFVKTFPGYRSHTRYFAEYKKWADTTLDTTRGVLRAAGLQSRQLQSEQAVIDALRRQASSPVGRMQALQVLQQIAENQVEQLMKLRQLMIADMSSKQAYQAAVIQQKAAAEAATERFFKYQRDNSDGRTFRAGWR
jgi:P-type conjugative transfer protein TrbJ